MSLQKQTFLPYSTAPGMPHEEERPRLSDRNPVPMT